MKLKFISIFKVYVLHMLYCPFFPIKTYIIMGINIQLFWVLILPD